MRMTASTFQDLCVGKPKGKCLILLITNHPSTWLIKGRNGWSPEVQDHHFLFRGGSCQVQQKPAKECGQPEGLITKLHSDLPCGSVPLTDQPEPALSWTGILHPQSIALGEDGHWVCSRSLWADNEVFPPQFSLCQHHWWYQWGMQWIMDLKEQINEARQGEDFRRKRGKRKTLNIMHLSNHQVSFRQHRKSKQYCGPGLTPATGSFLKTTEMCSLHHSLWIS